MTVRSSKPAFNIREKLSELTYSIGLKGRELMRAATMQDARKVINAGRKNLIINGDMRVAQRGTTDTTGADLTARSVDRFKLTSNNTDTTIAQGNLLYYDPPFLAGHRNYLRVTNTTGTTAAGSYRELDYNAEAQDLCNSGWNFNHPGSFLTLSFWVRASITHTFHVYMRTPDGTAQSFTFPIHTIANRWVKVEQRIPGSQNITVDNNNGLGLKIRWVCWYGTTFTGTGCYNKEWRTTGSDYTPDQSDRWANTSGATFDLTGVQLEVGKQATEYEHLLIADQLALCQRYFQRVPLANMLVATDSQVHANYSTNVQMRDAPSLSTEGPIGINDNSTNDVQSGVNVNQYGTGIIKFIQLGSFTGLTVHRPCFMRFDVNNNLVTLESEL